MRNEVLVAAHAACRVHRQHDRRAGHIGDVGEVAERVVAELGIADRQQHQLGDVGEREIVAAGRRIGDRLHADRAAGAGAGLDEELLLEHTRQVVGHQAVRTSAVPPAAKVLTMRTGRDGHSSAVAAVIGSIREPATSAAQCCFMCARSEIPSIWYAIGRRRSDQLQRAHAASATCDHRQTINPSLPMRRDRSILMTARGRPLRGERPPTATIGPTKPVRASE